MSKRKSARCPALRTKTSVASCPQALGGAISISTPAPHQRPLPLPRWGSRTVGIPTGEARPLLPSTHVTEEP